MLGAGRSQHTAKIEQQVGVRKLQGTGAAF